MKNYHFSRETSRNFCQTRPESFGANRGPAGARRLWGGFSKLYGITIIKFLNDENFIASSSFFRSSRRSSVVEFLSSLFRDAYE